MAAEARKPQLSIRRRSALLRRARLLVNRLLLGLRGFHPAQLVVAGYLSYILAGWLLLCLPWSQEGARAAPLDHLFLATSAVSTTGLVTVSVSGTYSGFGEAVILILIQLGGIGYMTLGSFLVLSRRAGLSPLRGRIGKTVFALPADFRIESFLAGVIWFTLAIELLGALALYPALRHAGAAQPLWSAVFHSVSAFCTAGFSLYDDSFESHAADFWVNAVIALLSYLGAVGFIACIDFARRLGGRVRRVTLTTRIILHATLWLSAVGTAVLFLSEPALAELPPEQRLLAAFFQCMTAMTTVGFNTVGIATLSKASLLLIIILMVIGSSPSGTGGGVKCTTVTAVLGVMRAALRGEREARFFGAVIPLERIWMAVASAGFYLLALAAGAFLLELCEPAPFERVLFEAASALGTVGLSTGVTPGLGALGKLVVILLMFCGRVGPLTFGAALFGRMPDARGEQQADLAV